MSELGSCRGCRAPIRWIASRTGQPHPCDPELQESWVTDTAVTTSQKLMLLDPDGDWQKGYIATALTPHSRAISGYRSHFATCPQAQDFRKRS